MAAYDYQDELLPARLRGLDPESRALRIRKRAENGLLLIDVLCRRCRRFLARQAVLIGEVEYKCANCKQVTRGVYERVGREDMNGSYTDPILPEGHYLAGGPQRIVDNTPMRVLTGARKVGA